MSGQLTFIYLNVVSTVGAEMLLYSALFSLGKIFTELWSLVLWKIFAG